MATAGQGQRAPKLSPEVQHRIINLIKAGLKPSTAFRESGITQATQAAWKRRADAYDADPESHPGHVWYSHLFKEVDAAHASAEGRLHAVLAKLALGSEEVPPDPELVKWILTRRFPESYSDRQRVELTGADGGAVQTSGKLDVAVRGVVILPAEVDVDGKLGADSESKDGSRGPADER